MEASISYALGANVENLLLANGAGNLSGGGNLLNNVLTGNDGDNSLAGAAGNDTLEGGAGSDGFVFNSALNALTNVDRITDFQPGIDHILLDHTVFMALAIGMPFGDAFTTGPIALGDRIRYDSTSGELFYDPDSTGAAAAVKFAVVAGNPALTSDDFLVVA